VVYDRLGKDITPPGATYQPQPEYANKARKKKIQGTVMVSIVITPEGTVRDAKVMTSLDKDLDQKALEAVSKWKFPPPRTGSLWPYARSLSSISTCTRSVNAASL
jgi:TonB family protein